jgi:hypothetical protein
MDFLATKPGMLDGCKKKISSYFERPDMGKSRCFINVTERVITTKETELHLHLGRQDRAGYWYGGQRHNHKPSSPLAHITTGDSEVIGMCFFFLLGGFFFLFLFPPLLRKEEGRFVISGGAMG